VIPEWAADVVASLDRPAIFATVSGAHLYGFPSADSDLDLRAAHLLALPELIGLRQGPARLEVGGVREGVELDVVSHELAVFAKLLLKSNGYVLEQLLSPLVVVSSELHRELIALAPGCITARHAHHYLGFSAGQWTLFQRTGELKPALYTLRVLLTGIHLMRTGELDADLRHLWPAAGVPYVGDLIEAKSTGEHRALADLVDRDLLAADVIRLTAELEAARDASKLPMAPTTEDALHDLVVRAHLGR
jgi:predicted nucleotidyltransferase